MLFHLHFPNGVPRDERMKSWIILLKLLLLKCSFWNDAKTELIDSFVLHGIEIVKMLPEENYETLKYLLKHLLKITEYRLQNRMHISNLAIVFGPTLMWAATESSNLITDMLQQNRVIEALLKDFPVIFR